jgi:quercetin dioxygenase-like cupin family protein
MMLDYQSYRAGSTSLASSIHTHSRKVFEMSECLWFTTARLTIHLAQQQNADGISLIEHYMARDFAVPLHVHSDEGENFYMLEGEVRIQIGDETRTMRTGEAVSIAAGMAHSFRVVSDEARFLTVTKGRFEDMVRSLGRPATTAGLPPQGEPTEEQIAALVLACGAHGIEFVGPPVN